MNDQARLEFRYRYVPYGTRFLGVSGLRQEVGPPAAAHELYENEIVTDVGGICWGLDGARLPVIDHHFFRARGQYPAAAAAVIHHAERIVQHFRGKFTVVWLVSHRDPDFDAFSSLYLVRSLLDGSLPAGGWHDFGIQGDGWFGSRREIAWYQPDVRNVPDDRRWALLLAAAAARVDGCKPSRCPRHRQLNAVLYAAIQRGRPYLAETSGACEFFEEVRERLRDSAQGALDPYFDAVFAGSSRFAPELTLLDREPAAYERDLQRAQKFIAFLPESRVPFRDWYDQVRREPLLNADGQINPIHLHPPQQARCAADGLFLRDPESLLFKEWARNDVDHSSTGQGFLFTGIAYSGGRRQAGRNRTDYYFSLDPERAGARHLYPVWARLQAAELDYLLGPSPPPEASELAERQQAARAQGKTCCRPGFEPRAGQYEAYFDDPWFDGANYECTIVPTPNRGTFLAPAGVKHDLSDDPVAMLVERELTESIFTSSATLIEPCADVDDGPDRPKESFPSLHLVPPPTAECFRFVSVGLAPDANLEVGNLVEQIGVQLWRQLDAENRAGVPTDFRERHLIRAGDWVAVWSRRGCAAAVKPAVRSRVDAWEQLFVTLCGLVRRQRGLLAKMRAVDDAANPAIDAAGRAKRAAAELARASEELLCDAVQLQQELSVPENAVLRRFFEASRLDDLLAQLRDLNLAAVEREQSEEARALTVQQTHIAESMRDNVSTLVVLQQKVEYVEIGIVLVYAAELLHILGHQFHIESHWTGGFILGFSALVAVTTALGLKPWAHHDHAHPTPHKFPRTLVTLMVLLVVSLVAFLGFAPREDHAGSATPPVMLPGTESHGHGAGH